MNRVIILILILSNFAFSEEGKICVSPVDTHLKYQSGPMEGRGRSTNYEVQIGSSPKKKLSEKDSVLFDGLDVNTKHLIKIYYEGTLDQSFWHRFDATSEYCLWYKSLYATWSIWPQNSSNHFCNCSGS